MCGMPVSALKAESWLMSLNAGRCNAVLSYPSRYYMKRLQKAWIQSSGTHRRNNEPEVSRQCIAERSRSRDYSCAMSYFRAVG